MHSRALPRLLMVVSQDHRLIAAVKHHFLRRGWTVNEAALDAVAQGYLGGKKEALPHVALPVHTTLIDHDSEPRLIEMLPTLADESRTIVLSSFASLTFACEAVRRGAFTVLLKPVAPEVIFAVVNGEECDDTALPTIDKIEAEYIHRVLDIHQGNISKAARTLGIARQSLQRKLRKSLPRV